MGPRGMAWDGVGWRGTAWDGVGPAGTGGDAWGWRASGARRRAGGDGTCVEGRGDLVTVELMRRKVHLNLPKLYKATIEVFYT